VTDYRVWVLEPRVQQQYTAYFSILNRELTNDLTSDTSPEFRSQARHVQDLVSLKLHLCVSPAWPKGELYCSLQTSTITTLVEIKGVLSHHLKSQGLET
jgi:hypothetical protein